MSTGHLTRGARIGVLQLVYLARVLDRVKRQFLLWRRSITMEAAFALKPF